MKHSSESVLLTAIHNPKAGSEAHFVKQWNELIGELAHAMHADNAALYYNSATDSYLAFIHFSSEAHAKKFLASPRFKEALKELHTTCFIEESFDIYHERAA